MGPLLTGADSKEALSRVYVGALAARAGYSTSVPEPDRDSVDLRIQAGGPRRPAIDLQLKATTTLPDPVGGSRPFRLPIKNYPRSSRRDADSPPARGLGTPGGRIPVDERDRRGARASAARLLAEPSARP